MNKKELEKMFDEKFSMICENMPIISSDGKYYELKDIKEFIFNKILPEVLKKVIDIRTDNYDDTDGEYYDQNFSLGCRIGIERLKQRAKELYGITI